MSVSVPVRTVVLPSDNLEYKGGVFYPDLIDVFDYPIVDGELLQENLNGPQDNVDGQLHKNEIRIKTE